MAGIKTITEYQLYGWSNEKELEPSEEDNRYVINNEGEILNTIESGDKIVKKKQSDYLRTHIKNFKAKEAFCKLFLSPLIELHHDLTPREASVLLTVIPFISYSDGVLRYNRKIVDVKTMAEMSGDNYDTYRKAISSLIDKQVLTRFELKSESSNRTRQCLVANPYIFLRGRDPIQCIAEMFEDSKWAKEDYAEFVNYTEEVEYF